MPSKPPPPRKIPTTLEAALKELDLALKREEKLKAKYKRVVEINDQLLHAELASRVSKVSPKN